MWMTYPNNSPGLFELCCSCASRSRPTPTTHSSSWTVRLLGGGRTLVVVDCYHAQDEWKFATFSVVTINDTPYCTLPGKDSSSGIGERRETERKVREHNTREVERGTESVRSAR